MTRKEKWSKACEEYYEGHATYDICRTCEDLDLREGSKCSKCKYNCNVKDKLWQEWKLEETLKERGYSDPEEIDKEIKRLLG